MANAQPVNAEPTRAATTTWTQRLRGSIALPRAVGADITGIALLDTQVWIDQAPWRVTGFWCVLAALLASDGLRQLSTVDWKAVALLALLVDPLWGSIWRMAGGRTTLLALPPVARNRTPWLPYLRTGSPAARLMGGDHTDVWPFALRMGLPTVVLALAVAGVLGWAAVGFTVVAILIAAIGWTLRRTFGTGSPLLASLVAVGLPWALSLLVLGHVEAGQAWLAPALLIGLWVIHQWGALRAIGAAQDWAGLALMAMAQLGICLLLIAIRAPIWLALVVLLFLPTWLLLVRQQPLSRMRAVWLGALLVTAVAVGQAS